MKSTRLSFYGMVSDPYSFFNIFTIFLLMLIFTVLIGLPVVEWLVFRPEGTSILKLGDEVLELAKTPRSVLLLLAIQNSALILLIYFRVIKFGKKKPVELGITSKDALRVGLMGLVWSAVFISIIALVTFALSFWEIESEPPFGIPTTPVELIMILIAGCIFAPIAEELFFRAYIITAIKKRYSVTFAYMFSALFFAAAHASLEVMIPMVLMGLFLAYVFEKYQSVLPCIIIHATNNFFAIMALYLL
jgi:membrane protease YdiL (CAAX protease family)